MPQTGSTKEASTDILYSGKYSWRFCFRYVSNYCWTANSIHSEYVQFLCPLCILMYFFQWQCKFKTPRIQLFRKIVKIWPRQNNPLYSIWGHRLWAGSHCSGNILMTFINSEAGACFRWSGCVQFYIYHMKADIESEMKLVKIHFILHIFSVCLTFAFPRLNL